MEIYIYTGGERIVGKSGVGQAIRHQRDALHRCGITVSDHWTADTAAVHINTVLPDSVLKALGARLRGKKVIWYGHSTMEDFRRSFRGSDLMAPLFRRWITFCYGLGDVVITPTEYAASLLRGYGVRRRCTVFPTVWTPPFSIGTQDCGRAFAGGTAWGRRSGW